MKTIKVKKHRTFKLHVTEKQLNTIALSLALMYENDYTHDNWLRAIAPLLRDIQPVLGIEDEYGLQ